MSSKLLELPQELLESIADSIDPGATIIRQPELRDPSEESVLTTDIQESMNLRTEVSEAEPPSHTDRRALLNWTLTCQRLRSSGTDALYRHISFSNAETMSTFLKSARFILQNGDRDETNIYPLDRVKMVSLAGLGSLEEWDKLVATRDEFSHRLGRVLLPNANTLHMTHWALRQIPGLIKLAETTAATDPEYLPDIVNIGSRARLLNGIHSMSQPTRMCFDYRFVSGDRAGVVLLKHFTQALHQYRTGDTVTSINHHVSGSFPRHGFPCYSGQVYHVDIDWMFGRADEYESEEDEHHGPDQGGSTQNSGAQHHVDVPEADTEDTVNERFRSRFRKRMPQLFKPTLMSSLIALTRPGCLSQPPPPPPIMGQTAWEGAIEEEEDAEAEDESALGGSTTTAIERPLTTDQFWPAHAGCSRMAKPIDVILSGIASEEFDILAPWLCDTLSRTTGAQASVGASTVDDLICIRYRSRGNWCQVCGDP